MESRLIGLVVEDAPSGIRSGHAAGSKTLAVLTSHSREQMVESETQPDFIVDNLTRCAFSCSLC
jgi:beta-phosphoglucomutase-like phosphatase (HAD superfamily)